MKEFLNGLPRPWSNVHACLAHTLNINIINIEPHYIEAHLPIYSVITQHNMLAQFTDFHQNSDTYMYIYS